MKASDSQSARDLVLRHGWNVTAYQILNPGIKHWFSAAGDAVVGYVRHGGVVLAAGAPICAAERLAAVSEEFEKRHEDETVCYFAAAARLEENFRQSPRHNILTIGAQPAWDPHHWPAVLKVRPSLRAQLRRALNKEVRIDAAPAVLAHEDSRLQECLDAWLAHRGLPPLHFLVEPQTFAGPLEDRRLWIARRHNGVEAATVAFLLASPVVTRNGWLVEQIVRLPGAPNGTTELLIDAAMRDLANEGATYITLGLVALSQHAGPEHKNPLWFRALTAWAHAHGRRFYNFDGLDAFRKKLNPEVWETIYAISNEKELTPKILYAIAAAFAAGAPVRLAAGTFGRAIRQEARWLRERWSNGRSQSLFEKSESRSKNQEGNTRHGVV